MVINPGFQIWASVLLCTHRTIPVLLLNLLCCLWALRWSLHQPWYPLWTAAEGCSPRVCRLLIAADYFCSSEDRRRFPEKAKQLLWLCVAPCNTHSYLSSKAHSQNADWEIDSRRAVLFKHTPILCSFPSQQRPYLLYSIHARWFFNLLCSPELDCATLISSYFYLMDKMMGFFKLLKKYTFILFCKCNQLSMTA